MLRQKFCPELYVANQQTVLARNTFLLLLLKELFGTFNFDNILSFLKDIHLYSPM